MKHGAIAAFGMSEVALVQVAESGIGDIRVLETALVEPDGDQFESGEVEAIKGSAGDAMRVEFRRIHACLGIFNARARGAALWVPP